MEAGVTHDTTFEDWANKVNNFQGDAAMSLATAAVGRSQLCELLWDVPNDPRGELRWCLSKIRGFVDEPGRSVEQADLLVAEVMKQLARTFAEKRAKLEPQLVQGETISTEDLRVALQHYRSFFDRLLTI